MNPIRSSRVATRATLWFSGLFALALAVLLGAAYLAVVRQNRNDIDSLLASEAREVHAFLDAQPHPDVKAALQVLLNLSSSHGSESMFLRLVDLQGRELASSDMHMWAAPELPQALSLVRGELPRYVTLNFPDQPEPVRVFLRPVAQGMILQAGHKLVYFDYLSHTARITISLAVLLLGFGTLVGYTTIRRAMRGVEAVTRSAVAVGLGNFSRPLPAGVYGREIDELSQAFEEMRQRIARLVEELREVTTNVAHDMRTPLTRIRAQAESLLDEEAPSTDQAVIQSIIEESDRLAAMITTALEIAELESGARFTTGSVDLAEVVSHACEFFEAAFEAKGIVLECMLPPENLPMRGTRGRVQRAVANLLDNALKYTPPGGRVNVILERRKDLGVVTVADTGPGIAPSALAHIFDRFYRGDASRSSPGHGLGLAMVRALAEAYGGSVQAFSTPGQGARFELRFPIRF